jgi:hypothetical protein
MQSETGVVAVPASADTWTTVNTFTVPAGVTRLVKVSVSVAPDMGATGTVRVNTVFRLIGSGLLEQSPHEYIGPAGDVVLGTSGAGVLEENNIDYDCDIPVQTGGTIQAQVITPQEAITAGTVRVQLTYDVGTPQAKNSQSQYANAAATTTADAWATVGTLTVPRMAAGNSPDHIEAVTISFAPDQAAGALLRTSCRIRLTGSGIAEGGAHEILGPANGTMFATPGVLAYSRCVTQFKVNIPVNAGGNILIEHILDSETPTAGSINVALDYA